MFGAAGSKMIGGEVALPGEIPFQVSLTYNNRFDCSGSIIGNFLILTAAACVMGKRPKHFRATAGVNNRTDFLDHNYNPDRNGNGTRQTRIPKYIYMHESYDVTDFENDVALIVLSEPFVFNSFIQKILLPEQGQQFQGNVTASGWGAMQVTGTVSEILMKASLPIVRNDECEGEYAKIGSAITDGMLCAGEAGRDACHGDSGGPGVCPVGNVPIL